MGPSSDRERARRGSVAVGLGYALTDRTVFTFDLAGGSVRTSATRTALSTDRFASVHVAAQHDLTRRVFLSASFLQMNYIAPYGSHFSDFGAGWRFTRNLYTQYLYSTDYGVTSGTHTLMLRWVFGPDR
jgi:hypothetical protein